MFSRTAVLAAENGCEKAMGILIEKGKADVNMQDNDGKTPLHWAVASGQLGVVKYFVNVDASIANPGKVYLNCEMG